MSTTIMPNAIGPDLNILNAGSAPVDLANVKSSLLFHRRGGTPLSSSTVTTRDITTAQMTGFDKSKVVAVFVPMGATATPTADTYLELSFTSASLPPGTASLGQFSNPQLDLRGQIQPAERLVVQRRVGGNVWRTP